MLKKKYFPISNVMVFIKHDKADSFYYRLTACC